MSDEFSVDGRGESSGPAPWYWAGAVWVYILLAGLLVQFVVLPVFLPSLDCGNGLMRGGDSVDFHNLALAQVRRIQEEGWAAWSLRPGGQSAAGIASAVYVLSGRTQPWTMLPVYGLLWAVCAWILFRLVRDRVRSDARAILCSLPFVLAPSALLFLTQIQKDPIVIAGTLCVWLALIRLFEGRNRPLMSRPVLLTMLWMIAGLLLLWVGRPYTMFLSMLSYSGVCLVLLLADVVKKKVSVAAWLVLFLSFGLCFALTRTREAQDYATVGRKMPEWVPSGAAHGKAFVSRQRALDVPFRRMATMRHVYLAAYPGAGSKLDEDVALDSSWRVVAYIPRALQLLLLAPFPATWSKHVSANPLYALVYAETAVCYLLYPGFVWFCWVQRRSLSCWIPLLFFLPWGVVYTIVTPNLGTLVRVRFSLVMTMASLGVAGSLMLWEGWRKRKQSACRG